MGKDHEAKFTIVIYKEVREGTVRYFYQIYAGKKDFKNRKLSTSDGFRTAKTFHNVSEKYFDVADGICYRLNKKLMTEGDLKKTDH
jgi:hypothetical protein